MGKYLYIKYKYYCVIAKINYQNYNKKILNLNLLPLIRLSNTSELFISNNILKLNDLVMFRNIILIYKLLNKITKLILMNILH